MAVVREEVSVGDLVNGKPYFIDWIQGAWQKSIGGIFETGDALRQAKAELPTGEFLEMVKSELPFKERTSQRLMKVSSCARLRDAAHVPYLPFPPACVECPG